MEILNSVWVWVLSILGGLSLSTIFVFVLKLSVGSAVKRMLAKINVEKIAEKATEKGVEKVKKISFTHNIQPLVESGLQKINEQSNEYIEKSIKRLENKLDKVILIQEKQAAYFDNSIGVNETAKEELKQAILEAKNDNQIAESIVIEESEPKKEKTELAKTNFKVER